MRWRGFAIGSGLLAATLVALNYSQLRHWAIQADALYLRETGWNLTHPASVPRATDLPPPAPYDWLAKGKTIAIAHALGPLAGVEINSKQALSDAGGRGFSIIEVDLAQTREGKIICFHEKEEEAASLKLLSTAEIVGRTHNEPCVFSDLVKAAKANSNFRFIIDVKSHFWPIYTTIKSQIGDPILGKQFVPQVYDFADIARIRHERFFAEPIFTAYRSPLSNHEIVEAARRFKVGVIVLHVDRIARLTEPTGTVLLAHPVEDFATARWLICAKNVSGIYTMALSPRDAPTLYQPVRMLCARKRQ